MDRYVTNDGRTLDLCDDCQEALWYGGISATAIPHEDRYLVCEHCGYEGKALHNGRAEHGS